MQNFILESGLSNNVPEGIKEFFIYNKEFNLQIRGEYIIFFTNKERINVRYNDIHLTRQFDRIVFVKVNAEEYNILVCISSPLIVDTL